MTANQINPVYPIDVIIDTDVYNGFDDQFAVSYVLSCPQQMNLIGITAAPFSVANYALSCPQQMNPITVTATPFSTEDVMSPANGMSQSYYEVMKILTLFRTESLAKQVFMGSTAFLSSEFEPLESNAAKFIIAEAKKHTPEAPLYILALGPATNIASALLMDPSIVKNCIIIRYSGKAAFNINQDVAAANVLATSDVSIIECDDTYCVTNQELQEQLYGKNPVAHYLGANAMALEQYEVLSAVRTAAVLLGISDRDAVAADLFARIGSITIKMDMTGYKLVFEDNFEKDGLDLEKWEPRNCGPSSCGFKGPDNIRVENGKMILHYGYQENGVFGPGWYGADVHLLKRYTRGYFECRCICNDTYPSNFWSAFWLQAHGPYNPEISRGGPGSAEIDVMEAFRKHLPSDPEGVRSGPPGAEANVHVTGMKNPPYTFPNHGTEHPFPIRFDLPDCFTNYHTYALEWTKEVYRFFVDGICILETTWGDGVSEVDNEVCVSICVALNEPEDKTLTGEMIVDYVKIWQKEEDIVD